MRRVQLALIALVVAGFVSCGGSSSVPTVSVSISPTSATVQVGQTVQFAATVSNHPNPAVTWQVNNITGGNATVGTVSASGLFTAPASVPNPDTVTVKAISQGDSTKSASATVKINPTPPITVSISPTNPAAEVGTTIQFIATVSNTSNTNVTWQVNNLTGGDFTVGTITNSGLYTAPSAVPSPDTVTVKAISQADPTKTATTTVTITPVVVVTVSPSSAGVIAGGAFQFSATVENTANTAVNWQVNSVTGGDTTVGQISATGLYTAPQIPPPTGRVTVSAVWQGNPARSGSSAVTVLYSNASLNGQYAFSFNGSDASGLFLLAGSFVADGNGNITSGVEDLNHGTGVSQNIPITGTYSIGNDGRGTASLSGSTGVSNFRFVMLADHRARVIAFDNLVTGSGVMEKQDTNAFSNAAFSGDYAFAFDGLSTNGPMTIAGRFTADGAGLITAGVEDFNDAGAVTSDSVLTGTYDITANGRGTATLVGARGTNQVSFYVISAGKLRFVSLDFPDPAISGLALKQELPAFSDASLSGGYAFLASGSSATGALAQAGRFTADGAGSVTNGVFDQNDTGLVVENVSFTGNYAISANGRGLVTLTSALGVSNFVVYLASQKTLFMVQIDGAPVLSGDVLAQEGGPFSAGSTSGSYGLGVSLSADISGRLAADGAGNFNGTEDENNAGILSPDVAVTGTYTATANGRGTTALTTSSGTLNFRSYVVSPSKLLLVGVDPTGVLIGILDKQF